MSTKTRLSLVAAGAALALLFSVIGLGEAALWTGALAAFGLIAPVVLSRSQDPMIEGDHGFDFGDGDGDGD